MATDVRDKADAAEQAMRRHAEERDRRVLPPATRSDLYRGNLNTELS